MLIGVIADDFTGASDIANTLAKGVAPEGGMATAQYSGIPAKPAHSGISAGVIALKSRSAPVEDAIAQSLAALDWLKAQGCRQFVFKYCSTFDSTADGNIGPVAEALANALATKAVVVCPAFPTAGRTVYQAHLFVFDKLLNRSGMEHHPITPMTEPDLRLCMAKQCVGSVAHADLSVVRAGSQSLLTALQSVAGDGHSFCVVDAIGDDDLLTIGEAVRDEVLVTGGSGVAMGLPRNFIKHGISPSEPVAFEPIAGPAAILAGSCSNATRGQIDAHKRHYPFFSIDVAKVMTGEVGTDSLLEFIHQHGDTLPLIYSSATPDVVLELQSQYGGDAVSTKLDNLFANTASSLIEQGLKRLVVAGGETSGAVAQAVVDTLGVEAMFIGPEIDPGVPILRVGERNPISLALKSGNFGTSGFFAKAMSMMEGKPVLANFN